MGENITSLVELLNELISPYKVGEKKPSVVVTGNWLAWTDNMDQLYTFWDIYRAFSETGPTFHSLERPCSNKWWW